MLNDVAITENKSLDVKLWTWDCFSDCRLFLLRYNVFSLIVYSEMKLNEKMCLKKHKKNWMSACFVKIRNLETDFFLFYISKKLLKENANEQILEH